MHGIGRASSAITLVNALSTGVGCALGIGLYVEAEVFLRPASPRAGPTYEPLRTEAKWRTPLVEATLRAAMERFAPPGPWITELELRSEIPQARGLKSSSAVASSIALAIAAASGRKPDPLDVARLSAQASLASGVSATGALDDALAGVSDGFVVTDNLRGEVLRTGRADSRWAVVLFIPEARHDASPSWAKAFRKVAEEGRRAVVAAIGGDWWTAMELNSELVERTMGYDYRKLRSRLGLVGALGTGVSGLGPTLAAVGPESRIQELRDALPSSGGERRVVAIRGSQVPSLERPR